MKKKPYKAKPGEMEIRILSNGKVMMVLPDEKLIEIARLIELNSSTLSSTMETEENVRNRTRNNQ